MYPRYLHAIFESLHPAQLRVGAESRDVSWHEIAQATDKPLDAFSKFEDFAAIYSLPEYTTLAAPLEASPSDHLRAQLVRVLRECAVGQNTCLAGFDNAWGSILPQSPALTEYRAPRAIYFFAEIPFQILSQLEVFPAYWWPKDRSWVLVTPTDVQSSLLACNLETADAVLSSGIEVFEIQPNDAVLF